MVMIKWNETPHFEGIERSPYQIFITAHDGNHVYGIYTQDNESFQIEGTLTESSFKFTRFAPSYSPRKKEMQPTVFQFKGNISIDNPIPVKGEAIRWRSKSRTEHDEIIPTIKKLMEL